MWRRVVGIILILIGLVGLGLSITGVIVGRQVIDQIGLNLKNTLSISLQSLDTIEDSVMVAKVTLSDVNQGLDTSRQSLLRASQAVSQTKPLIDQAAQIASQDLPNSLETVQTTIPNIAEVSNTIDDTLTKLRDFEIDQTFFGFRLNFDLGLEYNPPDPPLDETITQVGVSLDALSTGFRDLENNLKVSSENTGVISQDLAAIGQDLGQVNRRLLEFSPILDDYLQLVSEARQGIDRSLISLDERLATIKLILTVALIWFGLAQITPLYLGWDLFSRGRPGQTEATRDVEL